MGKTATLANIGSVADGSLGFRNRIINGDMRIAQRGTGAVSGTGGGYAVDRWVNYLSNGSLVYTLQQSSTAPPNYTSSLALTITTGSSSGTSLRAQLVQVIEGNNIADLGFGTANAKAVTLSFWVRSSLTGQFGGSICNYAQNRSYPFTYTISAANTWEQKSITIAGDTTGTWNTDNSGGIMLHFDLGTGTALQGTAGAWAGADYRGATGDTSVVATTGATWYVTGVQLEKGSTATAFDYRPYGTELALCERYGELIDSTTGNFAPFCSGSVISTTAADLTLQFRTKKRSAPTVSYSAVNTFALINANGTNNTVTGIATNRADVNSICMAVSVASGLVAGNATRLMANNTANPTIFVSAEL